MKRFLVCLLIILSPSVLLGLTFGTFTQISATGGNGVPPLLVVSSNGNAFAAWINSANSSLQVAYFNNAPGGGWRTATVATNASAPQIGIDGSGNAFVVWVTQGAPTQIIASRFTAASPTTSTLTQQLSASGTYNSSPQIAVGSSGVVVVSWIQTPFTFLSKSFNPTTGVWNTSTVTLPVLPASLALDGSGNGFAIINSFSGPVQGAIQVSRITAP